MGATIDDIDRQLLDALLGDGRASASALAEAADVATSTATKRLAALEDDGVVVGYQPEVDYEAFGYDVTAVFRLDVAGDGLIDVVAQLRDNPNMIGVYEVTGATDIVAIGKFESTNVMNAQIKALITREHVRSVGTDVVLDTVCEYDHPPVTSAE
jgi:DNA-binding Lrp family transcriptional regulator